ncbi:MAG: TIGR03936 family radical SAM-associated protein [Clostridia bacterium]|nr:TIGR03936 family radical SAM-associated protein [Clostridia bacterium]
MADIRVCFTKLGNLKYISHLDLQRAIHRMLVRSGLPISYSEGFNPHPRLNIALPLSIYQEGERELCDFRVTEDVDVQTIKEKLQSAAFPGLDIVSVEVADRKLATKRAVWRLVLETDITSCEFESALSGEMKVVKRSKTGEKTVDISPMVKFVSCESENGFMVLRVELNAAGNDYLNPSYVAAFFGDRVKIKRVVRENIIF